MVYRLSLSADHFSGIALERAYLGVRAAMIPHDARMFPEVQQIARTDECRRRTEEENLAE